MIADVRYRRWSASLLFVSLIAAILIFGKPARYSPAISATLTAAQLLFMGGATVSLLLPAWRSCEEQRCLTALAGLFLILPWALLTLMPGYGPPFASDLSMNHVRFVILFVSAALLGVSLMLLKGPLSDVGAGDRILAPIGQASGVLATLIQLVWAAIMIGWTMSEAHRPSAYLTLYGTPLGNTADVLLYFAGLVTYISTAFYALSFVRQGWIVPVKGWAIIAISGFAIIALVIRGLQYPDLAADWYTAPGTVVGIPAIPWVLPYMLGICALFRAAGEPLSRA